MSDRAKPWCAEERRTLARVAELKAAANSPTPDGPPGKRRQSVSLVETGRAAWAEQTAQRLLEPLGRRWQHVQGVVDQARRVARILDADQAEVLTAAAWLHDVGYAPALARTGFHPLDGARWLREQGHERLACLVAHHSGAGYEAEERGLHGELAEFPEEHLLVARALTYSDLTVGPDGRRVDPQARLEDVIERYGAAAPARAIRRAMPELLSIVREVEAILDNISAVYE